VIPIASPDIDDDDRRLVDEVLRSGRLAFGPMAKRFEQEFAERFGARAAVAVASGTAALHLAVVAAGVGDGDCVITSPYSFVASSNAILYERGIPVFVDVDPSTLTMAPGAAIEAMRDLAARRRGWRERLPPAARDAARALRAILPVHLFGTPADLRDVVAEARQLGVAVIEDACEAIGAQRDGVWAGRFGDAAAFGFYPNKQMTTGEGGMLLTDRAEWAALFRSLRNHGREPGRPLSAHLGFNYRMDEMSAALGLAQLRRLDRLLLTRQRVAERYEAGLAGVRDVTPLSPLPAGARRTWFVYVVRLAGHVDRDAVMRGLEQRGIMTRPYFWPIHRQPYYVERFGFREGDFPAAEAAGRSTLALPMGPAITAAEIDGICAALAEQVSAHAAR
jgi:dTDP-4-amino-4,6-dideoxygalactose transaminase